MITKSDTEKYKTCSKLLDEGKNVEAIKLADSIINTAYRAAIFIDGGFALKDIHLIRKGTKLFEGMLQSDTTNNEFSLSSILYNAANGFYSLYKLKRKNGKVISPPNDTDLRRAKSLFRQAIENIDNSDKTFKSQVWVNYGNCLSQLGRFIDAIDCYEFAFHSDPENGMALGNLGIEIENASVLTGRYKHEYSALAYDYLHQALSSKMHLRFGSPQAIVDFRARLAKLENFIKFHKEPILSPEPTKANNDNAIQNKYLEFCIRNGLFLNSWAGNKNLSPGVTDDISFCSITTAIDDNNLVPELLNILNEIKESYTTARYLFFLAQSKSSDLDEVSRTTTYFDNFNYSLNGIYIGLFKAAYSRSFDVLDKVARIVNVYFGIGKRENAFWEIFSVGQSLGQTHEVRFVARQEIAETDNPSMFALSDICIDYFENAKVDLKTIDVRRNRITHDYLNVKLFISNDDDKKTVIGLDELKQQTKDVLLLAKNAVIYIVSAINIAEKQKNKKNSGVFPITYDDKQGDVFKVINN